MLIFDNAYNLLKQAYIVPLSQHQIKYSALKKHNIKTALCNAEFSSVTMDANGKDYVFSFTSDRLIPALLGDIWQCYIRSELQCSASKREYSLQPDFCPNWSIVSDYYGSFYDASTLLRIAMRGNVFLDDQTMNSLKEVTAAYLGSPFSLDQNCVYYIERDKTSMDRYDLHLQSSKRQTHETVWIETGKLLREMKKNCLPSSDELTVLSCLINCLNSLGDTFPSQLRNAVNYQLPYGMLAVEKKIHPANAFEITDKWLDPILTSTIRRTSTDQSKIAAYKSYALYIHILTYNLIAEYLDIRGQEFGILSAINKHRTEKLPSPSPIYTYR